MTNHFVLLQSNSSQGLDYPGFYRFVLIVVPQKAVMLKFSSILHVIMIIWPENRYKALLKKSALHSSSNLF